MTADILSAAVMVNPHYGRLDIIQASCVPLPAIRKRELLFDFNCYACFNLLNLCSYFNFTRFFSCKFSFLGNSCKLFLINTPLNFAFNIGKLSFKLNTLSNFYSLFAFNLNFALLGACCAGGFVTGGVTEPPAGGGVTGVPGLPELSGFETSSVGMIVNV